MSKQHSSPREGMKRAYSMDQWQVDFARAFAAAVPLEAAATQARGALLASANDEPEPTPETPQQYAKRRAAENDRRALDLQMDRQSPLTRACMGEAW
ncbi:MAG: hypothetical protein ABIR26_17520 [Ramlibacter sp.]